MSEKKKLIAAFLRRDIDPGNIDFKRMLVDITVSTLNKNKVDADAFVDANFKKYWSWLMREVDLHTMRGLMPCFSFIEGGGFSFTSNYHSLLASTNKKDKQTGALALSRPAILRKIDALTNREYEALACIVCESIGSTKTHITPPGNEGGIDFFATLSTNNSSHIFSSIGTEVRIIGQCKKYVTPVTVDKLEQFITTLQNVRHRSERVRKHIPGWFDDSRGPIIGWIIAHSGFQAGASDEAKNHGIIVSDSLDLAEALCLSRSFHSNLKPEKRADEIVPACRKLL